MSLRKHFIIDPYLSQCLDIHSTFQPTQWMESNLKTHFVGLDNDLAGVGAWVDIDKYWVQDPLSTDGTLNLLKNKRAIGAYARRAFDYPYVISFTKLPNMVLVGNESGLSFYFGLEAGSGFYNGILSFNLTTTATVTNQLRAFAGPVAGSAIVNIDVNKPANFLTAYHVYRVIHSKNLTIFTIDHSPVLFAIPATYGTGIKVKENVLPYSIALVSPLPRSITPFVEISATNRTLEAASDTVVPLAPYRFRISDGHEMIPLRLPLYEEDTSTLFAGKSLPSASVTSHPFPVFGYEGKTVKFRSSQAGTLDIQVYCSTGSWRTYDSEPVAANVLEAYPIAGDDVLARVVFTPSSYPCTITEAEVVLR